MLVFPLVCLFKTNFGDLCLPSNQCLLLLYCLLLDISLLLPISLIDHFLPKGEKDMKSKGRNTYSFLFVEGRKYFLREYLFFENIFKWETQKPHEKL